MIVAVSTQHEEKRHKEVVSSKKVLYLLWENRGTRCVRGIVVGFFVGTLLRPKSLNASLKYDSVKL